MKRSVYVAVIAALALGLAGPALADAVKVRSDLVALNGANLTNLNASALASGTVPNARLDTDLQAVAINNGGSVTNLNADNLASGTVPNARLALADADVPDSITVTNYPTKAEADAAYAPAAQGASATNAETALLGMFGSVDVVATSVSTGAATIVCTAQNIFGSTLAASKTFVCWFEAAGQQGVPTTDGMTFSLTPHGDVSGYFDLGLVDSPGTNYVYAVTTHTDGTADFAVSYAAAEAGTNYVSVLGPNGTFSRTAVPHID